MFNKVLVANRGEIAVRIIRALKELGITSVAVFSEADEDSLHVQLADEAYYIGPAQAVKSYLNVPAIIEVAGKAGVDAIHPGYGFLSENPHFAAVCETWGIEFIGPNASSIERMGYKSMAREIMIKNEVPVIPGTEGSISDEEQALGKAAEIGYPVLVKAAAGGGGRGIRIANTPDELKEALAAAKREAQSIFGNAEVYLEKFLENPRHIEFQVLADKQGNVIHLGERESSLQRRRQKILEEALSPAVSPELRDRMSQAAIKAAKAVNYTNAGTVEFLVDKHGNFYFIEMNTRIQVEHPATEMITGVDIVKEQIRIAAGHPLSYKQEDIKFNGWAIECRINAEDPEKNFMPSPGTITKCEFGLGSGVRVDAGIQTGSEIKPYYDSLVAKIVTWGKDRQEAINRMQRVLSETKIEGVQTTIPLHQKILTNESFRNGDIHTRFLEDDILKS